MNDFPPITLELTGDEQRVVMLALIGFAMNHDDVADIVSARRIVHAIKAARGNNVQSH
jgi:hypothetical protein